MLKEGRAFYFIPLCILLLSRCCLYVEEDAVSPLPEPLTLEYALQLAGDPHPDIVLSRAELEEAEARYLGVESRMETNASIVGRAQWVNPPGLAPDQSHNDSSLSFYVKNEDLRLRQKQS